MEVQAIVLSVILAFSEVSFNSVNAVVSSQGSDGYPYPFEVAESGNQHYDYPGRNGVYERQYDDHGQRPNRLEAVR